MQMNVKHRKRSAIYGMLAALAAGGAAILLVMLLVVPQMAQPQTPLQQEPIPEKNRRIFLSPSVQYINAYAYGDTNEGEQMQLLAADVEALLTEAGFTVYCSRADDTLEDAVALSNRKNIGLHLALHTNASQNGSARGCEVFVARDGASTYSIEAAELLLDAMVSVGSTSRGVKLTDTLYETNQAAAEAVVLLEVEFHDNEAGAKWIVTERETIAQAIADAVLAYYETETK